MTITSEFNFSDPGEYTYDSSVIEVSGGVAKLILKDNIDQEFNQDFSSDAGFTYDNTKAEFTGGLVQQKDQSPTDSRIGITYSSDLNAAWNKDGLVTGTILGGATHDGGNEIDCTGNSTKAAYYAVDRTTKGSIKFLYRPNYTGGPATNTNIIGHTKDNTDIDEMVIFNSPSGNNIRMTVRDNTGSIIANAVTIAPFAFVSGQQYEILFQYDSSTGDITVYIGGTRLTPLNIGAWTRGIGVGRIYVGANSGTYNKSDGKFTDILSYTEIQEAGASYTPGYSVPEYLYSENEVELPQFSYSGLGAVQAFQDMDVVDAIGATYTLNGLWYNGSIWTASSGIAESNTIALIKSNIGNLSSSDTLDVSVFFPDSPSTKGQISDLTVKYTGQTYISGSKIRPTVSIPATSWGSIAATEVIQANTDIKYTIVIGGSEYWYDGGAWAVSNGTESESSDLADINTNIATLPIDSEGSITQFYAYLITTDIETPEIDLVTVQFTYDTVPQDCPLKGILFVSLRDIDCDISSGGQLRVVNETQFFIDDTSMQPSTTIGKANSESIAFVEVVITESVGQKYHFYVDYRDSSGKDQTIDFGYSETPDQIATNISTLTFTET